MSKLMKILVPLFALFSLAFFTSAKAATVCFPQQGCTGTSTIPSAGQILVGNTNGTYKVVNTSTLGFVATETDPIWTAFLANPIFTSLTSTNFFATSSVMINSITTNATSTNLFASLLNFTNANGTSITTTNLEVSSIYHYGPSLNIYTDSALNEGDINIHAGNANSRDINLYGVPKIYNPNDINGFATLDATPLNVGQSYSFQNKTGILAMTDDNISEFTNDAGYITNAGEIDPIWTAFLADPIFTSLTSTNAYLSNLTFVNATGTNITSTNGFFNSLFMNTSTKLGSFTQQGIAGVDPIRVMSSSAAQLFAVKANGQVVVGPNDLAQTGALTIQSQPGNDITLSFTDAVSYTFQLGKVAGTSGRAFIGGPFGTALALRAGGTDRVLITNDTGFVGINTTTPQNQLVVVGSSTVTGITFFNTATGTSITSTNLYVSSKAMIGTTTNTYALNVVGYTGSDRYYTSNPNSYLTADGTTGITATGGNFTISTGYLYASTAGTSFYSQGGAVFRGALSNDTGVNLTLSGGTSGNTNITGSLSVVGTSTLATTSITSLTFTTASGTALTSTNAYITSLVVGSCIGCGSGGSSEQRVGTSTANYFTYYLTATTTTGTPLLAFSGSGITFTTNTIFSYVSSTSGLFGGLTTTNFAVTGSLVLPNDSVTDAMVVPGLTISGGTIDNSPIGNTAASTGIFTSVTTTNLFATTSNFVNVNVTSVTSSNLYLSSSFNLNNALTINSVGDLSASGTMRVYGTFQVGSSSVPLTNSIATFVGSSTNYLQINLQNTSASPTSSGDYIITSNNGSDTTYFTNLGMNGSNNVDPTFTVAGANYGYLYTHGLGISIGTASSSAPIYFFAGGTTTSSLKAIISGNDAQGYIAQLTLPVNQTSTVQNVISDPDIIVVGTAVASTLATYSDDITRMLTFSTTAGTGAISLKSYNLVPGNTNETAFYNIPGTLQTITASTLGSGASSIIKGAITCGGYHYAFITSSGLAYIKRATSSWSNDISTFINWPTSTISGTNVAPGQLGIVGCANNNIYVASGTTKIFPYAITTSTNTLTSGSVITITGAGITLAGTRVNDNGIYANFGSAPFVRRFDFTGASSTQYGGGRMQAITTNGPNLFVLQRSYYSQANTNLLWKQSF